MGWGVGCLGMSISAERAAFFLNCLQSDSARLAEVGRMGLQAPVPCCAGWTVETVLRHTAQVYLHKVEILRLGARPEPWPPPGLAERDALDLYDDATARVIAALAEAGTDLPTWTFSPDDKTSAFWYRRMAQETAVHRADAELAHSVLTPIDRELALDGIDEILVLMLGGLWEEGDTVHPVDAAVRITADGRSWTARLDATSATVTEDADGDVATEIFGDANAVLLWLWGRVDDAAVQVVGDETVARAFRNRLAECTT